ncbi:MAG: hypothetical protein QXW71_00890 [Thermoplasmata archaeon]
MEKENQKFLEEIKAFIGEEKQITLHNGKVVVIKPLVWKKELQIIKLLGEIIPGFTQSTSLDSSNLVQFLLKETPDILTEIAVILTDCKREEIENEWILEDIVEVCLPFLQSLLKRLFLLLTTKIQPILQNLFNQK